MSKLITGLGLIVFFQLGPLVAGGEARVYDIPRLDQITVDGNAKDWGGRGFVVDILANAQGELKEASDLDASFRLGWDERGLLVLIEVTDDRPDEAKTNELYERDSVELFFAPVRGGVDVVQMVVSPGIDPERPELRFNLVDERHTEGLKKSRATGTVVRSKTATGYILEVLLPWDNFEIKPMLGREAAFQIFVNDSDAASRFQARWYPKGSGHEPMNLERLRLAEKPSPPILVTAFGDYEKFRRVVLRVTGGVELVGKSYSILEGKKEIARGTLVGEKGRAGARVVLPLPTGSRGYGDLLVVVDRAAPATFHVPNLAEAKEKAFMEEKLAFTPNVFAEAAFPPCDFEQPSYVEDLIGPYSISTRFYDATYQQVPTAEKPGRYGAVVEIKTADGKIYRRLRTLFRMPQRIRWSSKEIAADFAFPVETGIDPAVAAGQKYSTSKYLKLLLADSLNRESMTPALLSALYEAKAGRSNASIFDDFQARDRQWWVGLKRRLSGADKLYPGPFVAPSVIVGKPSPVLREGTLREAGMKAGAADRIDAVLKEWVAQSSEAFAVCVARHGVIILQKAYGKRDGQPMTLNTKSRMASITKAMSGTAMMMLVDQGLVNLDDPVSKYLPSFQDAKAGRILTVRHLYTHTAGMEGHWGDDLNDFDDLVAGYYGTMPVGKAHDYNGASLALGSKIVEIVSGEALPQFYQKHLLKPLGCDHTEVSNSSYDAYSTPLDMAKFGQMLLNRGSYGNMRFMSGETFERMLPIKLTQVLGTDSAIEWGIGLVWFKDDGLGRGTYAHGAASSAILRMDPENDLVISMTRNAAGAKFQEYQAKFFNTIVENLAN